MSIQEAASAIIGLINSKPTSPTQEEIEAVLRRTCPPKGGSITSPLLAQVVEAMAGWRAANAVAGRLLGDDFDAAEAEVEAWEDRIEALEEEIPNPPQSDADIAIRAVLARFFADQDCDVMSALEGGDVFDSRAARLVEAVLQSYGLDPTKPDSGVLGARQ